MSIRPLPEDVIHKLRSTVVVSSLNGVVCELLKNALDAGSTKVNAHLDYSRGNCTLEDNGQGILPSELNEGGGLGRLHHTSKQPPTSTLYGTHGDFLAALANLSLVSITSRHQSHVSHNSVTFHNGEVLARQCPCPPGQGLYTFQHGTRVTVRDLFGSLPVRVKHRAILSSDKTHAAKEWTHLLVDVVAILLSWPSDITVLLHNSEQQQEVRLKSQEASNIVIRTSRLLSQSNLAEYSSIDAWVPVSASSHYVKVKGCIYLHPVATRRCQFISLGIHPISDEHGTNFLYEQVNKAFTNSTFAIPEDPGADSSNDSRSRLKSRSKTERWPMFYLEIQQTSSRALQSLDDVAHDRQSNLSGIIHVLQAVCYGFLKRHHMQPRKSDLGRGQSSLSTSKKLQAPNKRMERAQSLPSNTHMSRKGVHRQESGLSDSPFVGWGRIKSGQALSTRGIKPNQSGLDHVKRDEPLPLLGAGGRLLRKPFLDVDLEAPGSEHTATEQSIVTREVSLVGNKNETMNKVNAFGSSPGLSPGLTDSSLLPDKQSGCSPDNWLQAVLQSWQNPVFETAERPIPQAYEDVSLSKQTSNAGRKALWPKIDDDGSVVFESSSLSLQGRVSRNALANAEVIAQVDCKYILLKLPLEDASSKVGRAAYSGLVMMDQHAADERCQLEKLMAEYFVPGFDQGLKAAVELLERPQVFEVPSKEGTLLIEYRPVFVAWGIIYSIWPLPGDKMAGHQVEVTGLPPSIIERCRTEPRLVIDLLRNEAWRLSDDERNSRAPIFGDRTDGSRTSHFRNCPRGILELLHSRSCRSAIMFNDVLSRNECEGLLRRLVGCDFPFQCAHGRPCLTPLISLGERSNIRSRDPGTSQVTSAGWKRFMEGEG